MTEAFNARVWKKTLPSRSHPERDEDLAWSAANSIAHAVIDGMGGSRRLVAGREIGGEHAAATIGEVLSARLENLPEDLGVSAARELLSVAVTEAGGRIFRELNEEGNISPTEIPEGKNAEDVMVAAVMTALVLCEGGRRAVIGQNGDTRCYLYSANELILLTDDQDAIQMDVEQGVITPEQGDSIQEAMDTFDGRDIGKMDPTARKYFIQRNLVFGQV